MSDKFRRQIHQSGMNVISQCGEKFRFRYIERLKSPRNSFLLCGTATDKAVGFDLNTKILTGELAKRDDVLDVARDTAEKDPEGLDLLPDEDEKMLSPKQLLEKTIDKAVRLVDAHHKLVAPMIQPFRTARPFSVTLDKFLRARAKSVHEDAERRDLPWERRVVRREAEALNAAASRGWDFAGEMDIIEGYSMVNDKEKLDTKLPFAIRDTKTASKSKSKDEIDHDDQLTGYTMASMVIDGPIPVEGRKVHLDVLVDLKAGVRPQLLSSFRTNSDVDVYLNRIANAVSSIQQGVFVPARETDWWCSQKWCPYFGMCRYAKRPRSSFANPGLQGKADDALPKLVVIQGGKK